MNSAPFVFVIPTYRLRDVAETIEKYDEHFWSNGHSVKMIVFDDSSLANHENIIRFWNKPRQSTIFITWGRAKRNGLSSFCATSCGTEN
jgi:hypothetical protein